MDVVEVSPKGDDEIVGATVAYGVSMWHLFEDRQGEAEARWKRIVDGAAWPAFGHIAAEAELERGERK
jgi:hypothetical protein